MGEGGREGGGREEGKEGGREGERKEGPRLRGGFHIAGRASDRGCVDSNVAPQRR